MEIIQFDYEGNKISFDKEPNECLVRATEMAKPFNKRPIDWLRLPSTESFLDYLSEVRELHITSLVKVVKGNFSDGSEQGTWLHEDVAMEFARWLSPKFAIWCNDRIKELMKYGFTATDSKLEEMIANPDLVIGMAEALKTERAENERIKRELELSNRTLMIQAPTVQYANQVLKSESAHTTTTIAAELSMSGRALNEFLRKEKIQYKQDGHWVLMGKYKSMDLAKTRTFNYNDSEGHPRTEISTVWTEIGRKFIHDLAKQRKEALVKA